MMKVGYKKDEKVVKLNLDRKVRYIFDRHTPEYEALCDKVMDHYGSFFNHSWTMVEVNKFHKTLRECGMSVSEFISTDWSNAK